MRPRSTCQVAVALRVSQILIHPVVRAHSLSNTMSTPPGQRRPYLGNHTLHHLASSPAFATGRTASPPARPSSATFAAHHGRSSSGSSSMLLSTMKPAASLSNVRLLDNSPSLIHATPSVVKTRMGTVLSRGCILKTDHYPTGKFSNYLQPFAA
jgi:hypothetical protein